MTVVHNSLNQKNLDFIYTIEMQALICYRLNYRGADKSLARRGRKQATATEDFVVQISYL